MRIKSSSRSLTFTVILACALLLAAVMPALSQKAELYEVLFGEKDKQLKDFKNQKADLLSPNFYTEAVEKYAKAKDDFKKGKETEEVRKKLSEVEAVFKKIENTLWTGRGIFDQALKAREDALNARAPEFTLEEFNAGEEALRSAGGSEELGDQDGAREKAAKATAKYRDSELNAIKKSVMAPAREAYRAAEKSEAGKFAPKTLDKAKTLVTLSEEILNSDRYAVADATAKAEESIYEAQHAIQIKELLKNKKYTQEELVLLYEEGLGKIARELGFAAAFDQPLDEVFKTMINSISSLKAEKQQLGTDLAEKQEMLEKNQKEHDDNMAKARKQIDNLLAKTETDLALAQQKEAALQEELAQKQAELAAKREKEAKVAKIRDMFLPGEATVLQEGNRLIIRLLELTFPVGKSVIQPSYFGLLSRVQRAIREYPEAKITIEGHTDAIGDERYNETLSTKRAESVRAYLLANMVLSAEMIEAVGYGESRPVANNETEDGRAQNRRIDVVLVIE